MCHILWNIALRELALNNLTVKKQLTQFVNIPELEQTKLARLYRRPIVWSSPVPNSWEVTIPLDEDTNKLFEEAKVMAKKSGSTRENSLHLTKSILQHETSAAYSALLELNVNLDNLKELLESC